MHDLRTRERAALDEHLELATNIKERDAARHADPAAVPDVIAACERVIAIAPDVVEEFHAKNGDIDGMLAPPSHVGFERLIILGLQAGLYEEAERLEQEYKDVWGGRSAS